MCSSYRNGNRKLVLFLLQYSITVNILFALNTIVKLVELTFYFQKL